jgi:hypothetical protein
MRWIASLPKDRPHREHLDVGDRFARAMKPERVACLDEGFAGNDQLKANAVQTFKTKGVPAGLSHTLPRAMRWPRVRTMSKLPSRAGVAKMVSLNEFVAFT